jgi:hypothetical protein
MPQAHRMPETIFDCWDQAVPQDDAVTAVK